MGHEHKIICKQCGQGVQQVRETKTFRYFACPCGKTTYERSKEGAERNK